MKKIIVPDSIKKKVRRDFTGRIIKLIVLLAVFTAAILLVLGDMSDKTSMGNWSFTLFVLLIVPFIICGIPAKFFDRSYYGKIISIEVRTASENEINRDERRRKSGSIQHILVEDEQGKIHTVEIFDEGQMFPGREKTYNKGDRVVHVYGCTYVRPWFPKSFEKKQVCVVCGNKNEPHDEKCRECGCSLEIEVYDEKGNRI